MINANIITSRYLELNTHTRRESERERGGRQKERERKRETDGRDGDRQAEKETEETDRRGGFF